ncbi:glycine cleavage system protein R [Desulfovulcanus sp.]
MMQKFALSVLGQDRPGIVARVAEILADFGCNIEDLSQTILQGEFAAIYIFSKPEQVLPEDIVHSLKQALTPWKLTPFLKPINKQQTKEVASDHFVVTAIGQDAVGQIAALASIMRDFGCNITGLKAINHSQTFPDKMVMVFEIAVPLSTNFKQLRDELQQAAHSVGLEFTIQHRDIFENIHRI